MTYPRKGLFIAGSDTEVGKTHVACLIARSLVARGHKVGVYKPVASGAVAEESDGVRLWHAAGCPAELATVCPQEFKAALAPGLAAKQEGADVDTQLLFDGLQQWNDRCDIVLVEGIGGLMSPISSELYCADLAEAFGYPLVVVVPNRLGAINQALQTLITAAVFRDGLDVAGVVVNDVIALNDEDESTRTNADEIRSRCQTPFLGHLSFGQQQWDDPDWFALASRA